MSCITEILKLKDDKEFLPIVLDSNFPDRYSAVIEGGDSYKGYEYLVTFTEHGGRCGYVAIPPNHEFNEKNQTEIEDLIECHGGMTFFSEYHPAKELLKTHCNDFWIGFDCLHGFDGRDTKCIEKYFKNSQNKEFANLFSEIFHRAFKETEIRDFKFVENQCKSIIDQLIILNNG